MSRTDQKTKYVLGIFPDEDKTVSAIKALKNSIWELDQVHSPFPSHKILDALELKQSRVGYFTLAGGFLGFVIGFSLAVYTAVQWHLMVSGKPIIAWFPFFIVAFEFTILFGCLANFLAMLVFSGLPRFKRSPGYDERFSVDAFGLYVTCRSGEAERLKSLFTKHGALEVHERF